MQKRKLYLRETFVFLYSEETEVSKDHLYKDFFQHFFEQLPGKVKDKIICTFELIEELPRIPETYLKHIENTDGLYEIRVQSGNDIFRIFFDKGQLVVIANGFQKKDQKTPKKEIERALKIKQDYEKK